MGKLLYITLATISTEGLSDYEKEQLLKEIYKERRVFNLAYDVNNPDASVIGRFGVYQGVGGEWTLVKPHKDYRQYAGITYSDLVDAQKTLQRSGTQSAYIEQREDRLSKNAQLEQQGITNPEAKSAVLRARQEYGPLVNFDVPDVPEEQKLALSRERQQAKVDLLNTALITTLNEEQASTRTTTNRPPTITVQPTTVDPTAPTLESMRVSAYDRVYGSIGTKTLAETKLESSITKQKSREQEFSRVISLWNTRIDQAYGIDPVTKADTRIKPVSANYDLTRGTATVIEENKSTGYLLRRGASFGTQLLVTAPIAVGGQLAAARDKVIIGYKAKKLYPEEVKKERSRARKESKYQVGRQLVGRDPYTGERTVESVGGAAFIYGAPAAAGGRAAYKVIKQPKVRTVSITPSSGTVKTTATEAGIYGSGEGTAVARVQVGNLLGYTTKEVPIKQYTNVVGTRTLIKNKGFIDEGYNLAVEESFSGSVTVKGKQRLIEGSRSSEGVANVNTDSVVLKSGKQTFGSVVRERAPFIQDPESPFKQEQFAGRTFTAKGRRITQETDVIGLSDSLEFSKVRNLRQVPEQRVTATVSVQARKTGKTGLGYSDFDTLEIKNSQRPTKRGAIRKQNTLRGSRKAQILKQPERVIEDVLPSTRGTKRNPVITTTGIAKNIRPKTELTPPRAVLIPATNKRSSISSSNRRNLGELPQIGTNKITDSAFNTRFKSKNMIGAASDRDTGNIFRSEFDNAYDRTPATDKDTSREFKQTTYKVSARPKPTPPIFKAPPTTPAITPPIPPPNIDLDIPDLDSRRGTSKRRRSKKVSDKKGYLPSISAVSLGIKQKGKKRSTGFTGIEQRGI